MFNSLSIRNLLDGGWRTVLSITGISFAIVLIFMQLGFLGSVLDTAVLFYNNFKFDLVVRSPDYYHFCDANTFSKNYLRSIENVEGVQSVQPYHISLGKWNYAEKEVQRGMLIMGVDPNGQTFSSTDPDVILPDLTLLTDDRSILADRKSHTQFLGFDNRERFSEKDIGLRIELNQNEFEVVGLFKIGTGLAANGASIVHERGFKRIFPNQSEDDVTLGLVQLQSPSSNNPETAQQLIYRTLGFDPKMAMPTVEVLTREEVVRREILHWLGNTPIGFIFIAGVIVAFMVGAIVVYIVLSADITKQMGEYATLKAMGYRNRFLYRVVLEQAFILGIVSYLVAFCTSLFLYEVVGTAANLPIKMTFNRQLIVVGSTLLMSFCSGAIAIQKLRKADPADLF